MGNNPENRRLSLEDHSKIRPSRVVSPGAILKSEIKARGWTQSEFANIIGRSVQNTNEVINGKRQITIDTALLIEAATGIEAAFWLRSEIEYRLRLAEQHADELEPVRRRAASA